MAGISITSLSRTVSSSYLFKDIEFDLKPNFTQNTQFLKTREIKDLRASQDIAAIKNSLFNLFTTQPGQKILNPIYGLNLTQYLFSALSPTNARVIGQSILEGVNSYEPRVEIKNINVEADYNNNQYNISLLLNVPSLNIKGVTLKGTLSQSGYYFN
jgi:phage baseplate assembly protein W